MRRSCLELRRCFGSSESLGSGKQRRQRYTIPYHTIPYHTILLLLHTRAGESEREGVGGEREGICTLFVSSVIFALVVSSARSHFSFPVRFAHFHVSVSSARFALSVSSTRFALLVSSAFCALLFPVRFFTFCKG